MMLVPGRALLSLTACRSEPAPLLLVFQAVSKFET